MTSAAIHLVVGTRPEMVQAFPLADAVQRLGRDLIVVLVSQHTDPLMSSEVLPADITSSWKVLHVNVQPFSLGTALCALTTFFDDHRPHHVVVIGDTDTSLAAAIAATEYRISVAHVEAGLRSNDWAMKEERNRVLIDHLATTLFPPTVAAEGRLSAERVHGRVVRTGDVHVDAFRLLTERNTLNRSTPSNMYVCTLHRRENILESSRLEHLVRLLNTSDRPVRFLAHPHTMQRLREFGLLDQLYTSSVVSVETPLPFLAFVQTVANSAGVITDSGGVQKQAYLLGVPCITLRTATEWTETLEGGWNVLADPAGLTVLPSLRRPGTPRSEPFGDGHAAERILSELL